MIHIDPICGMSVDSETAAHKSEYKGKTYYFCSRGCKVAFDKDPERYVNVDRGAGEAHHEGHH